VTLALPVDKNRHAEPNHRHDKALRPTAPANRCRNKSPYIVGVENDSGFVLMPGRLLTNDEARRIAVNIAKLLDFPIFADGKRQIVLPITSFLRILPIA